MPFSTGKKLGILVFQVAKSYLTYRISAILGSTCFSDLLSSVLCLETLTSKSRANQ
jgi:hypothetical protein